MTTVFQREIADGPRMHVLVVGVGTYPHCGPGSENDFTRRLRDLPGAAISAAAFAEWFIADQEHDTAVPLASVEVAISATDPVVFNDKQVQPATRDDVESCIKRWYERCDNPDSVAVFYFCGHGCSRDLTQHMLLLEDTGKSLDLFAHALNFSDTYTRMLGCKARTQCYFVDACREVPIELEHYTDFGGLRPVPVRRPAGRTTDLVVHSTSHDKFAYSSTFEPTRFATAVRQALAGGAAWKQHGKWHVLADRLSAAVGKLAATSATDVPNQIVQCTGNASATVLRCLPAPPSVRFDLELSPAEANQGTVMSLVRGPDRKAGYGPAPAPWTGVLPAGVYDADVDFGSKSWRVREPEVWVMPPMHSERLLAEKSP